MKPPTYYTVISMGYDYGHYVKFVAPPEYCVVSDDQTYQDPGQASQEFLKDYPGAICLAETAFTRKAVELEQQYKTEMARLKAWNGGRV